MAAIVRYDGADVERGLILVKRGFGALAFSQVVAEEIMNLPDGLRIEISQGGAGLLYRTA